MIGVDSAGLAVDEVMEPFKYPDDTDASRSMLLYRCSVSLRALEAWHTGFPSCSSTAPNPFSEA